MRKRKEPNTRKKHGEMIDAIDESSMNTQIVVIYFHTARTRQ